MSIGENIWTNSIKIFEIKIKKLNKFNDNLNNNKQCKKIEIIKNKDNF